MQQLVAGIDIGGTNTSFGLVDVSGKILFKENIPTGHHPLPQDLVAEVSLNIKKAFANYAGNYQLAGLGIGAPNGNFFNGTIEFAPNLKWKGILPIADYFQQQMGVKALLTNDANAAALGEMMFGGAQQMTDFIFITLGTGLGSGLVANGQIIYGHDGFAGEIGHIILIPNGRQCGCGRKGCVETYCSATGLATTYNLSIPFSQLSTHDSKDIYDKAIQGDAIAIEAFNYTGEMLGLTLANSVAFSSPEAIFLFGGLALAGDLLFKPTIKSFENNLLNIYKNKIKILPSQLKENDAAILGAASLIWKEIKA